MFYICVIVVELVFVDIGFYSLFLLHVLNSIRHIIYQDYHYWVIQPKKSCCEGWLLFPVGQQQSSFPMSPEFMILFLPRYVSCLKMALLQMYVYLIIIWLITFLIIIFSSPCQRQCELLPSLGIRRCRPLTFHILIFSSETPLLNEVKLGRKHLMIYGRSSLKIAHFVLIH